MAYGLIYTITFKNRFQNDIYRVEILQKDFAGDVTELIGSETPFIASYQTGDVNLLDPIKSCEFTISFITDGSITIEDFYSDDDEQFRIDFYFQSFADGTGTERRLYTGFLIQDGTSEPLTDRKHIITLKATDNLALLKNVKWNEVRPDDPIFAYSIRDYVRYSLVSTGLYDFLDENSFPLILYGNIFENSEDDRSVDDTNDPYRQTHIYSEMFQNDNSQWDDCYTILTKILGDLNAELIQADGCWNIRRIPEYNYFTDGAISGTQFTFETGPGEVVTAVTLDPLVTIDRDGLELQPINEDQTKSIERPVKYIFNTFNFVEPDSFIKHQNLLLPQGATPFTTNTSGGLRYDDYDLATYFPEWQADNGDTSYLEIVTDVATNTEQERYIVTPGSHTNQRGIIIAKIPVSKGDVFDFSIQFRTPTDISDNYSFWIRFLLILPDGTFTRINDATVPGVITWSSLGPATVWDSVAGSFRDTLGSSDTSEYSTWSLSGVLDPGNKLPLIPADGILMIIIDGNNEANPSEPATDVCWKDITLTITNYINKSTKIIGQTHTDTGTSTIKAISESELNVDDSPRNTIAGTLFTDALTNFDFTDSNTGSITNIGDVYFTKTSLWHRPIGVAESLRLGNIITQERLELQYLARTIIEGTFKNIRIDDSPRFVSPLNLFRFGFIDGKSFTAASMELDYMADTFRAKLVDIFKSHEPLDADVEMIAQKSAVSPLPDGMIGFEGITNYFNADDYITPSNTNSRFTYSNVFDTTIDLHETFSLIITGSGTVTFDLLKNGSIIDTQTLTSASPVQVIDFNLTAEAVTNGDYFECQVDTGGATVSLTAGTNIIIINGVIIPPADFPYQFNYLYKTD